VFSPYSADQLYGIIDEYCKIEGCENLSQIIDPDVCRHFARVVENEGGNMRIMASYTMEAIRFFLRTKKRMEFMDAIKLINTKKIPMDLLSKIPSKCQVVLIAVYNFVDMTNNAILDLEIVFFPLSELGLEQVFMLYGEIGIGSTKRRYE